MAELLTHYPWILLEDFLRYAVAAGGVHFLVARALHGTLRRRRIRPEPRPGWTQIRREIASSLRTVAIFALFGLGIFAGVQAGLLPVYFQIAERGWTWFGASLVLLIVAHDAWFYWAHRLMHRPWLYRLFHRTHHRSHNPTAFTAYSFDATEAAVQAAYLPLALMLIPAHPGAIFLFTAHMISRNAIAHSGVELFPARRDGRPLMGWLTTVTHHDLHHAEARWNLGLYFTWWDRLCGTEHPEYLDRFAATARPLGLPGRETALLLALALSAASLPGTGRAEALSGVWVSPGLGVVVRFAPCAADAALTCSVLVDAWDDDLARHVRAGEEMIHDLRAVDGGWRGRLTDARNGRRYRGRIRRIDGDAIELSGCAGPFCAPGLAVDTLASELAEQFPGMPWE